MDMTGWPTSRASASEHDLIRQPHASHRAGTEPPERGFTEAESRILHPAFGTRPRGGGLGNEPGLPVSA
jgi:hypothetical protein